MSEWSGRFLTRCLVIAAAAVAGLVVTAIPAHADVDVDVEELPRTMSVGSTGNFEAILENDDETAYRSVRLIVVVRMNNLRGSHVRVTHDGQQLSITPGNGTIRFTDPDPFPLDREANVQRTYGLHFQEGAPTGRATLTVEAFGTQERGGLRLLGRTRSQTINVREAAPGSTPSAESEPTSPAQPLDNIPTADPTDLAAVPNPSNAAAADDGLLWPIYLIGLLLLLLGAGAVAWLFIQRGREENPPPQPQPFPQPQPYGGGYVADAPTMLLPHVAPESTMYGTGGVPPQDQTRPTVYGSGDPTRPTVYSPGGTPSHLDQTRPTVYSPGVPHLDQTRAEPPRHRAP